MTPSQEPIVTLEQAITQLQQAGLVVTHKNYGILGGTAQVQLGRPSQTFSLYTHAFTISIPAEELRGEQWLVRIIETDLVEPASSLAEAVETVIALYRAFHWLVTEPPASTQF